MKRPVMLAESISKEYLDILETACPLWMKHILECKTWHKVKNIEFVHDDITRTLGDPGSSVVGECFGFSDSYFWVDWDWQQHDTFDMISLDMYRTIQRLDIQESQRGPKTPIDELFKELCEIFEKLAKNVSLQDMSKSNSKKMMVMKNCR